jgi:predicted nucleic acid-binding protein
VIVVDASVLATALGDDGPDGDHARARLRGERLSAPELVDLEVTSVLRRQVHTGAADLRRAALALADLAALPLRRAPHRPLLARCWELRDNLTVYDASYVALAEALEVTLLTADGGLARAPGLRCHVETLRPATLSGASSFLSCRRQAPARSAYSGCVHDVSAETLIYSRVSMGRPVLRARTVIETPPSALVRRSGRMDVQAPTSLSVIALLLAHARRASVRLGGTVFVASGSGAPESALGLPAVTADRVLAVYADSKERRSMRGRASEGAIPYRRRNVRLK